MTRARVTWFLIAGNLIGAAVNVLAIFALDSDLWIGSAVAVVFCTLTAAWLYRDI